MYHDCLRIPNESILRAFRKMHDGDRSLFIGENFIEFILSTSISVIPFVLPFWGVEKNSSQARPLFYSASEMDTR